MNIIDIKVTTNSPCSGNLYDDEINNGTTVNILYQWEMAMSRMFLGSPLTNIVNYIRWDRVIRKPKKFQIFCMKREILYVHGNSSNNVQSLTTSI